MDDLLKRGRAPMRSKNSDSEARVPCDVQNNISRLGPRGCVGAGAVLSLRSFIRLPPAVTERPRGPRGSHVRHY